MYADCACSCFLVVFANLKQCIKVPTTCIKVAARLRHFKRVCMTTAPAVAKLHISNCAFMTQGGYNDANSAAAAAREYYLQAKIASEAAERWAQGKF